MSYQFAQTASAFPQKALDALMILTTPTLGDATYQPTEDLSSGTSFASQDVHDIVDIELSEANQAKLLWNTFFDNELNEVLPAIDSPFAPPATSEYMQKKIKASINHRLLLAKEGGNTDLKVSEDSKASLFRFAQMQEITTAPSIILRDNGNLSASWGYKNGDRLKLIFLKNGTINYVAFLNKLGKRNILHDNKDIAGVMEFIKSHEIIV